MTIKIAKIPYSQRAGWPDWSRIKRGIEAVGQHNRFGPPLKRIFAHHQIERFFGGKNNPISLRYHARFQSSIDMLRQKLMATKRIVDPGIAEVRDPLQADLSLQAQADKMIRHRLSES